MVQLQPRNPLRAGFLATVVVAAVAWSCAVGDNGGTGSSEGDLDAAATADGQSTTDQSEAGSGGDSADGDGAVGQGNPRDDAMTPTDSGRPDSSEGDATRDTGVEDGAVSDGAPHDAHVPDAAHDTGAPDTGTRDTGSPDTGIPDSSEPDSGAPDSGAPDTGPADSGAPHDAADASCGTATVVVNEVQTAGTGGLEDEWVELFNPSACPVDISSWTLRHTSASGTSIDKVWTAAAGTVLAGNGYGVVAGTQYTASAVPIGTFGSGVLAEVGGGIGIYDVSGTRLDSMGYGVASTNPLIEGSPVAAPPSAQSAARIPNGVDTQDSAADFQIATTPTPGAED